MRRSVTGYADFWAGIVIALVGGAFFLAAQRIFVPGAGSDLLGPRAFPTWLSVMIMVLGAMLTARVVIGRAQRGPGPGELRILGRLTAAIVAYGVLFHPLGFLLSTVLFLAYLFWLLGERRYWLTAVVSICVSLVLYMGFQVYLDVGLPKGLLGI